MALNTNSKCNHVTPLRFKGLKELHRLVTEIGFGGLQHLKTVSATNHEMMNVREAVMQPVGAR